MSYQVREYFCNGQSILPDRYEEVEKAKHDQEIDALNSMGSGMYQSSRGNNFNQTGNQFQDSTGFNNYGQNPNSPHTNTNMTNQNGEIYSPNSNNMNYPVQQFDSNSNFNNTYGNTFQSQNNFYNRTDGQNLINQNNNMNNVGMRTNYQPYYPNNQNNQNSNTQFNSQSLEREVENLYDFYYARRGYFPNEPDTLTKFYLEYKNQYDRGTRVNERLKPLMQYRKEDVKECIKYCINRIRNRFRGNSTNYNSTFSDSNKFKRTANFSGSMDFKVKNNYNPKFSKETLRRLYPRQTELEMREKQKLNCDNFNQFFKKLLDYYYKEKNKMTNDCEELKQFWTDIEDKRKKGLEWENGDKDFLEEMDLFFSEDEVVKRTSDLFYRHTKFRTYSPYPLHNFWEHDLTNLDRYYNGLAGYNKDDFLQLLINYFNKLKSEEEQKMKEMEEEKREREEREKYEKQRDLLERKEEREEQINKLAIPKDKYKAGRTMLELKDKFKYDNIIKKMIKNEFKDNKLFKYPEEYAVRDEDEQEDILFKHDLDKNKSNKNKDEKIKEQIEEAYDKYVDDKREKDIKKAKRLNEKKQLFDFIKKKVKEYYKRMINRLKKDENGSESINHFLNNMYKEMSIKHRNATKLYFKKPRCEVLKKTYKFKKNHVYYPRNLKYFFFKLLRRLGRDANGKLVFAKTENLPFWGPSLSNTCKIHGKNCPIYCCRNTHNDMIKVLRNKNFNTNFNIKKNKRKLEEKENLNLWKRPDLVKEKEKIFMCFEDAEHCTFEPKLMSKKGGLEEDKEELINSRLNNMKWVNDMGENFTIVRGTIYKEGILKRAKILFADGRYQDTIKLLKKAFDLEAIKIFKEKGEYKPKDKGQKDDNQPKSIFDRKRDVNEPTEDFKNTKNLQLCDEVYFMLTAINKYKGKQKGQIKKLKKEIEIIEYNKQKKIDTKEINDGLEKSEKFTYYKDKYFNFFKTVMCPLKEQCPYLIPRWPHSDKKASEQYGRSCPYAHQVSELKFDQEIREKIKLRKNLLSTLEKGQEPNIKYEWVPTGPIVSCIGCGMSFDDKKRVHTVIANGGNGSGAAKGSCGFCQYNKRNNKEMELNKRATTEKNKKLLDKINYESKPEEIDQDYMAKFGKLKKAIILYGFRRYTDCEKIMDNLMESVRVEQAEMDQKFKSLDKKWRKKLEINEEINPEILNYNIDQNVLNYFNIKTPLATILIYCDKMRKGNKLSIYNRHTFLNTQIKEFNEVIKKTMSKYDTDVHHLRKQIDDLSLWMTKGKKLKSQNTPKAKRITKKMEIKYKDHMCDSKKTGKSCDKGFRECHKGAHNPNQLNLIKPKKEKELMVNNMKNILEEKKQSKSNVPWSYAHQGYIQPGPRFNRSILNQYGKEVRRTKSAKRIQERDIQNQIIRAYEI